MDSSGLKQGKVAGDCKEENEPLDSTQFREFLYQLNKYQLLKKLHIQATYKL
jgi:hypothetical protein